MTNELRTCFEKYLLFVGDAFRGAKTRFGRESASPLLLGEDQLILRVVDEVEKAREFTDLARVTARDYRNDDNTRASAIWELHVYAYFRLSGLYQALFRQQRVDFTEAADRYWAAFKASTNAITHLAPLELLDLSKPCLDCGDFEIHRFTKLQLDQMLGNSAKKIFYPWAYVDAAELENYWFICARETASSEKPGGISFRLESRVELPYSAYPTPIVSAMCKLALFNWVPNQFSARASNNIRKNYKEWDGPLRPKVPFVLTISDCLIRAPAPSPDLAVLAMQPFFDQVTGEEIGEVPARALHFDDDATEYLADFMRSMTKAVAEIQRYHLQWAFIEVALKFLLKGFTSNGMEQLLWHITAIEAVLGEKMDAGLTRLLLRRISTILGRTDSERKDLRKRFGELYEFRSDLVHGNAAVTEGKMHLGHLSEARDFARSILLWTLNFLSCIAKSLPADSTDIPSRSALLAVLDLNVDERKRMMAVLQSLPGNFPNVSEWI